MSYRSQREVNTSTTEFRVRNCIKPIEPVEYMTTNTLRDNHDIDVKAFHTLIHELKGEHRWVGVGFGWHGGDKLCVLDRGNYYLSMSDYIDTLDDSELRDKLTKELHDGSLSFENVAAHEKVNLNTVRPVMPDALSDFLPGMTEWGVSVQNTPSEVDEIADVVHKDVVTRDKPVSDSLFMSGDVPTMSSKTIAEMCKKRHHHVLRDIGTMWSDISQKPNLVTLCREGYSEIKYDSGINKGNTKEIHLNFFATRILVGGYDTVYRAEMIKRLDELEAEKRNGTLVQQPVIESEGTMIERPIRQTIRKDLGFCLTSLADMVKIRIEKPIQQHKFAKLIEDTVSRKSMSGTRTINPGIKELNIFFVTSHGIRATAAAIDWCIENINNGNLSSDIEALIK